MPSTRLAGCSTVASPLLTSAMRRSTRTMLLYRTGCVKRTAGSVNRRRPQSPTDAYRRLLPARDDRVIMVRTDHADSTSVRTARRALTAVVRSSETRRRTVPNEHRLLGRSRPAHADGAAAGRARVPGQGHGGAERQLAALGRQRGERGTDTHGRRGGRHAAGHRATHRPPAADPPGTIADPEERLSRALRLHRHCLAEIAEILESSSSGAAPPVSARRPDPPARAEAAELVGAGSSERGR